MCPTSHGRVMQMKAEQEAPPPVLSMAPPPSAPVDAGAKTVIADLKAQLLDEQRKHKQAKDSLLSEQQYFASEIAQLESLTRGALPCPRPWSNTVNTSIALGYSCGHLHQLRFAHIGDISRNGLVRCAADAPDGTPGGTVYRSIQRIKKQVEAVQDGATLSNVRNRTMGTPPIALKLTPTIPQPRTGATPRLATANTGGAARPGTASTVATSRTPLSTLGANAGQSDADFWHRRSAPLLLLCGPPESSSFLICTRQSQPAGITTCASCVYALKAFELPACKARSTPCAVVQV